MRRCIGLALGMVMTAVAPNAGAAQADLNDLEMAHVAVTASTIDIAYAHLALAFSGLSLGILLVTLVRERLRPGRPLGLRPAHPFL